nr:MAG TPA: hypothetical protein [Caudoviricetes sp.]
MLWFINGRMFCSPYCMTTYVPNPWLTKGSD